MFDGCFMCEGRKMEKNARKKDKKNPSLLIILTTYNLKVRQVMYDSVIRWWTNNTLFPIAVIDSSGRRFTTANNNENLSFYHFNTSRMGSSEGEAKSLRRVFESINVSNYDAFVKVTGKYALPQFGQFHWRVGCDLYVQQTFSSRWQSSELFGWSNFGALYESLGEFPFHKCSRSCWKCATCMENFLAKYKSKTKSSCLFNKMRIPERYRTSRTHGPALTYL